MKKERGFDLDAALKRAFELQDEGILSDKQDVGGDDTVDNQQNDAEQKHRDLPTVMPLTDSTLTQTKEGAVYSRPVDTRVDHGTDHRGALIQHLVDRSLVRLIKALEGYGNTIGPKHEEALKGVLTTYANVAFGRNDKGIRAAYPLGPGLGKTQSVVAFIAEAYNLGYFVHDVCSGLHDVTDSFTVAVSAERIESLAEIKRDLVKAGVDPELIGFRHGYKYDKEMADDYLVNGVELPEKYATEPATGENEERAVLLCSHNLIKARGDELESFYSFRGKHRSLLIWDETLVKSRNTAISHKQLEEVKDWLKREVKYGEDKYKETAAQVSAWLDRIEQVRKFQGLDGRIKPIQLEKPVAEVRRLIKQLPERAKFMALKGLYEVSDEDVFTANMYGADEIVFQCEQVVPPELNRIVILDASHGVRVLAQMDKTIKNMAPDAGELVSYRNVTVHQMQCPSGFSTMEKVVTGDPQWKKLLLDIVDVVKSIPNDEGIIFFTFKDRRSPTTGRIVYFKDELMAALRAAGIDLKAEIDVKDPRTGKVLTSEDGTPVRKPRFAWMTHGNEMSTSKKAYLSNVIFCGVLHKPRLALTADMYGQSESDKLLHEKLVRSVDRNDNLKMTPCDNPILTPL